MKLFFHNLDLVLVILLLPMALPYSVQNHTERAFFIINYTIIRRPIHPFFILLSPQFPNGDRG